MMRARASSAESESGVVLIIIALALVVLIGMLSIAIDASYGFVQNRRAQNAADFAAFAAAQQLKDSTYCAGTSAPTMDQIVTVVQNVVNANDAALGTKWTGTFLGPNQLPLPDPSNPSKSATFSPSSTGLPPPGACGATIDATPKWTPFFAGIFDIHQLGGFASGSVAPKAIPGPTVGIVALNKVGPHEILGGGTGVFVVSGDIVLNTDVKNQPWSGTFADPATKLNFEWDDAIDAKSASNLYVYGTIHSNNEEPGGSVLWPLDTCFAPNVVGNGNPSGPPNPAYQSGDPTPLSLPSQQMQCNEHGGSVNIDYNAIDPTVAQISDPLSAPGSPPDPLNAGTDIACPGSTAQVNPPTQVVNGATQYSPGDYTTPVEITGAATFADCPGGYTGIFRFDQGLWINPQTAGQQVTGSNVVIATGNPYPLAGNVPGSVTAGVFTASGAGNGAPCLPPGTMSSGPSGNGSPVSETSSSVCGGTSPAENGVTAYGDSTFVPDATMSGTGNNFSAIIGGVPGTAVTLTGPSTGAYGGTNGHPGLVLYQEPGTPANYGFDAEAGDGAVIGINGVVYNASLPSYGTSAPLDYWDGPGGGIPFYNGGTLQAGFGAGWAAPPAQSSGSVTLTGTAIVDDFNTDGATTITIVGQPYNLPGSSSLSLIG